MYYITLGLKQWEQLSTSLDPWHLAHANETDPYIFSFNGHMTMILDGQREETQGSGHLGPWYVCLLLQDLILSHTDFLTGTKVTGTKVDLIEIDGKLLKSYKI